MLANGIALRREVENKGPLSKKIHAQGRKRIKEFRTRSCLMKAVEAVEEVLGEVTPPL